MILSESGNLNQLRHGNYELKTNASHKKMVSE